MLEEQDKYIGELYLEMYRKLKSYARSSLVREEQIEEAIQETFRIACQKPDDLINSPNPRGWRVKALRYVICNMRRSEQSARQLLVDYLAVYGHHVASVDKYDFSAVFGSVADTEEFRLVKEMVIDGKSHLELAEERGISVDACKKRMQRAKETLQKKLK